MATSQKFDALDGLEVTGQMTVGANLAVDTDTLYVDVVNDRVGINNSTPSRALDVTGSGRISQSITMGTSLIHDGDLDTSITFTTNQVDISAGGVNYIANTTLLSIGDGNGIQVRGVSPTSTFASNTEKANGGLGVNSINTSMILSQDDGDTGLIFGALTNNDVPNPNLGSVWSSTAADEISVIISDRRIAKFDNDGLHFNSLSASTGQITGITDIAIANSIFHTGDDNTYFQFNANDSARVVVNGATRFTANTSGSFIGGDLDVSNDIIARRIEVEDYFIETTVTNAGGTAVSINCGLGSVHEFTPSGNYSVDFLNLPTSGTAAFTLIINNNGTAREATWPGSGETDAIYWAESVEPPSSAGYDIYNFIVVNGKIYGSLSIRNAGWAQ